MTDKLDVCVLTFGEDYEIILDTAEAKDLRDYLIEKYPLEVGSTAVGQAALATIKAREDQVGT